MEAIQLDYASPATLKPPSNGLRLWVFWLVGLSGGVGLGILALYALTAWEALPTGGFFMLGIGGAMTFVALILAIVYVAVGRSRRFPAPSSPRRAAIVLLLPFANIVVAVGCFFGGVGLMEWHAHRVFITNEGAQPIDRIELFSPTFTHAIEPLGPGKTTSFHFPQRSNEKMQMRVHIGGQTVIYTVMESMTADAILARERYIKLNGLTGYKNQQGFPPQ